MNDWWKSPVLQGPENDYGEYDYLIEEIPSNTQRWDISKYRWTCNDCGKTSHITYNISQYFRTLDGYDSLDYCTCWRCEIKHRILSPMYRVKRKFKSYIDAFQDTIEVCRHSKKKYFIKYYKLMLKIHKHK